MKNPTVLSVVLIAVLTIITFASALAQSGGYDLTWNTINSGGGASSNSGYTLTGTIGQPEASAPLSNGGYTLVGGFWYATMQPYSVYLPLVLRGP